MTPTPVTDACPHERVAAVKTHGKFKASTEYIKKQQEKICSHSWQVGIRNKAMHTYLCMAGFAVRYGYSDGASAGDGLVGENGRAMDPRVSERELVGERDG